ncbi:MAG: hypothetical protein WBD20_16255, partial [Pirellulaceae bacterium]
VLDDIAAIAKTDWTADFASTAGAMGGGMGGDMYGGGMDMGMGMGRTPTAPVNITGVADVPLVKWSTSSQDGVLSDLFPWRGKPKPPSTLEVYYSQENLWILKQLLQIVSKVNGNARMPFEAKIREIAALRIGKSVSLEGIGNIAKPGEGIVSGMGGEMGMGMDDMGYDMESDYGDDMGGGMSMGVATLALDPAENRYVDIANQPITAAALRSALTSNQPADAPIAVAKRIPVMMTLQMDQRYIPELIAACGSAALMVEVKQTRIMPKGAGGAMGGSGGMESGMDEGGMDSDYGGGMGGAAAAVVKPADEFPLDVSIEIYGLIHLFNPPDEEALGVKSVTQETPMAESGALPSPAASTVPAPSTVSPPATDTTPGPAATAPATAPATGSPDPSDAVAPAATDPAAPATPAPTAPTAMATPN